MDSSLDHSRRYKVLVVSLSQLSWGYNPATLSQIIFSIVPAHDLTTSLQDLTSPLRAVPGCDIPRHQDFVPGGNMPGGPEAALKSLNIIVSLWCSFSLV